MLRRIQDEKKGPWHWQAHTGGFNRHPNRSPAHQVKQPPPPELRKAPSVSGNYPEGFICAWCGVFRPWSRMAGFDRRLKFCQTCHDAMDALDTGTNDALAILREAVW